MRLRILIPAVIWSFCTPVIAMDASTEGELRSAFDEVVAPFIERYCVSCHGKPKPKAKLDLSAYASFDTVAKDHLQWKVVLERLEVDEMPPAKAKKRPSTGERAAVVDWIQALLQHEALKNAGDPGVVSARRLSNAEYDYTIRDLTGVDIRPAEEFPIDPANEAGFDNSGETLAMSPALLRKYLTAARNVADHLVLTPDGFAFASHRVVTETDRDKYCVRRIVDFYERHAVDYSDYFLAAWRFLHRDALGHPAATLVELADASGLSSRYLETVWKALTEAQESGPLADVQSHWRDLPPPSLHAPDGAKAGCEQLAALVASLRADLVPKVRRLKVKGISSGSQPLVLWHNRQRRDQRRRGVFPLFCSTFPDAFFLSRRGSYMDPNINGSVRLLSAGFHLMQGYFRDDRPLYELVLDSEERRQIDALWRDLDVVAFAPTRQYKDFVFFERAEPPRFAEGEEFDFARSEDRDVTSPAKLERMARLYVARARELGADDDAIDAIVTYFANITRAIREAEKRRRSAEPLHLKALVQFTTHAFRRPLTDDEKQGLIAFYDTLRTGGLGHEDAIRDVVTSVLMSPHFCYHIDRDERPETTHPISSYGIASRLSYFLWSSLPDEELLDRAARGDLGRPEVIAAQARRMLRDPRVRGLATEFGGNWLDFRRFEDHNSVDRERFKSFTPSLRSAMFEEPIRFLIDLAANDGSVLDLLYAKHTFVNRSLAKHYGLPAGDGSPDAWWRVDDASGHGRGGLLPMAVFLTKNAPGLRTSPVKRGYWVVRRLLGERIPPPPPNVPELPAEEAKTGDQTQRELLARHRENPSCGGCHERFDAFGLAFEGFGPIGERRDVDLGGRPVDARVTYPGGDEGFGVEGLREYLRKYRQADFVDTLCRKLLAYALGRTLLLSDEPLLDKMRERLDSGGYRFGPLVETVVTSRQFLFRRGQNERR